MRILLVTESLTAGGAETFALRLARKLRELGHQCDLLCLNRDFEDSRLVGQFRDVPIIRLPLPAIRWVKRADRILKLVRLDWSLQAFLSARWIARHLLGRYDVYHTNLFGADWLFQRLRRKQPDLRQVVTLHGDYGLYEYGSRGTERTTNLNWRRKVGLLLRDVGRWVYIAEHQRRLLQDRLGADAARLVKIYNGYPAQPQREAAVHAATRFIMVARGLKEKGWGELLEAFGRLRGQAVLKLVGEGPFLDEMRKQYGHDPRIDFVGFHPSPVDLLTEADVFVFPTAYQAESLPTVVVEALACGKPVIATDVGEIAEMIRTPSGEHAGILLGFAGQLVDVSELAAAMQKMIDDPTFRLRQAARARQAFAKFDMDECAARYVALYREMQA